MYYFCFRKKKNQKEEILLIQLENSSKFNTKFFDYDKNFHVIIFCLPNQISSFNDSSNIPRISETDNNPLTIMKAGVFQFNKRLVVTIPFHLAKITSVRHSMPTAFPPNTHWSRPYLPMQSSPRGLNLSYTIYKNKSSFFTYPHTYSNICTIYFNR